MYLPSIQHYLTLRQVLDQICRVEKTKHDAVKPPARVEILGLKFLRLSSFSC